MLNGSTQTGARDIRFTGFHNLHFFQQYLNHNVLKDEQQVPNERRNGSWTTWELERSGRMEEQERGRAKTNIGEVRSNLAGGRIKAWEVIAKLEILA